MLYPWDIARLREEIQRTGTVSHFAGHNVSHARIRLAPPEIIGHDVRPTCHSLFRPPDCVFGRPEDASCLDGISSESRLSPAQTLYSLRNARIIGTVAALNEDDCLFFDGPAQSTADLDRAHKYNQSNAHGFVLLKTADEYVAHFLSTPRERMIRGNTIFISSQEIGNFGCFLYWALPQLALISEHIDHDIDQYVVTDRSPWIFEALSILGLPERPILTVGEASGVRFESLTMTNFLAPEGFFHPETRKTFRQIATRLRDSDLKEKSRPRKIYVSRALSSARAPKYRVLENEARIHEIVVDHGFQLVFPETLTFTEQIRLFAAATAIVGPSGSGMLSSIFSPYGATVVDMESFTVTVRQHARIYSSTDKKYAFCFGRFDPRDIGPDRPMRRWRVDELDLLAALDWVCRGNS